MVKTLFAVAVLLGLAGCAEPEGGYITHQQVKALYGPALDSAIEETRAKAKESAAE